MSEWSQRFINWLWVSNNFVQQQSFKRFKRTPQLNCATWSHQMRCSETRQQAFKFNHKNRTQKINAITSFKGPFTPRISWSIMIVWICDLFALKSMKSSNIWFFHPFFQLRSQFIITLQKKSQSPIQPNQIILDFSQIYTRLFQKSDNTFSEVHEHRNFSLTDCSIQLEMVFYLTAEPFVFKFLW